MNNDSEQTRQDRMAPITCKVIDTTNCGQPGVYVVLECKDLQHHVIATLESVTDEDGGISLWFPTPSQGRTDEVEPQIVDSRVIPRVSLTFFPHAPLSTCPAPFLSVQTDLYLNREECHGIILYLDPNPRLEHCPFPVASPLTQVPSRQELPIASPADTAPASQPKQAIADTSM